MQTSSKSMLCSGTTDGTTTLGKKEKMPILPASSRIFRGPTRTAFTSIPFRAFTLLSSETLASKGF